MDGRRRLSEAKAAALRLRGLDVGATFLLAMILVFATYIVATRTINVFARPSELSINIVWGATYSLSVIAAVWLIFVQRRGLTFADLGYVRSGRVWMQAAFVLGVLAFAIAWLVYNPLAEYFEWEDYDDGITRTTGLGQFGTHLLYVGVLGPIAEELAFRGLLFRWLRQRLAYWPAALLSAALFGLFHAPWAGQMVFAGLGGLLTAWLFERSRSLLPPILAHQTYNILVTLLPFLELRLGG